MKLHLTKEKVKNIKTDIENRKDYIGGSDIGTILGFNEFKSPYTLWSEKVGLIEPENIDDKEPVWWGVKTEALIAERFCQKTGKRIKKSNYAYGIKEFPFIRAHIDRMVVKENAGLECKATDAWKYNYEAGEVPPAHYAQCQFYMAVTGKNSWYLATHQGNGKFHINSIERNEEFIEMMLTECTDFWNHVTIGEPPEIDGSSSTSETIRKMFPEEEPGETVDLEKYDGELVALQELANQKKNIDTIADKYKNTIKEAMGTAEIGETSQFKVTWKTDKRGARIFKFKEKAV